LKHTAVKAELSGAVARVGVVQEFQNFSSETIGIARIFSGSRWQTSRPERRFGSVAGYRVSAHPAAEI
jgi:hypothetical protein